MSKNVFKVLAIVLCIAGCGGSIKQTVPPAQVALLEGNQQPTVGVSKVAVFPFSDYSQQQSALRTDLWGGNIKILEEVTDYFVAQGIQVAVQEDVNALLVENEIIQPLASQELMTAEMRGRIIGTPEYDLLNVEHSKEMQDEILDTIKDYRALELAQKAPVQEASVQDDRVRLTKAMIKQLGDEIGADLIIRGRIIEYGFKEVNTYNPLKRGFLPVLYEPIKDVFLGAPDQDQYEVDLGDPYVSQLGNGLGYWLGEQTRRDVIGAWDTVMHNTFGVVAELHPRKKDVSSIVQIRMYAQDVKTGNIIWSNRVETEFNPRTGMAFKSRHPKTMFDKNIQKGVRLLMEDLFSCISLQAAAPDTEEVAGLGTGEVIDLGTGEGEIKIEGDVADEALVRALQEKIATLEDSNRILLQQVDDKTLVNVPDAVLFPSGSDALTNNGVETLSRISSVLGEYADREIAVEGHTDNVPIGPSIKDRYATNWELSTSRAIRVMNYIAGNLKKPESSMSVRGYGPYKPVAPNDTDEGRALNRRVVIVIGPEAETNS
ncbi:MAG: flagellar motor protein MotB [Thermodesulfobacteriota bacterium]|nr:flagellar motor protein MotB [Thermodesulfobacteriota bacterium]